MKFNIVVGNPPFQDNINKKKTQHKIWPSFTEKVFSDWLQEGGFLGWITPQSWGSPSNKILELLKAKDVKYMNMDTSEYFPDVASTFSHYVVRNCAPVSTSNKTDFVVGGNKFSLPFNSKTQYVPSDLSKMSMNIHGKVMFSGSETYDVEYDYVTCHNVIRHAAKKINERILAQSEALSKLDSDADVSKVCEKLSTLAKKRLSVDISVSKEKTDKHTHPILHTNSQVWYSSVKQSFAGKKKVMWSRSGYTKPFFDNGELGCTDMGYYILVNSKSEGKRLESYLNSKLMRYIFKTAKWSGFGNEKVFCSIPKIDLAKPQSDKDIFDVFDISKEEQSYIDSVLNPQRGKSKSNGRKSETKSEHRVKRFGEVYTPPELIKNILDNIPQSMWSDKDSTVIDPACGSGNFLIEVLERKCDSGISPESALENVYGVDILQDNIDQTKDRMLERAVSLGANHDKALELLNKNIVCSDSLSCNVGELFS